MSDNNNHKHVWWHAPDVYRHLVCLNCGKAIHYPDDMIDINNIPHSTTGISLWCGTKMVGCNLKHPTPPIT